MKYPYEETGSRILMLRKQQGLTREQLAELSDISVQFLADIEKGRKNMTVTTLRKLSAALLVSTDFIVNGIEQTEPEIETDLLRICKSLSRTEQAHAVRLLRVFAGAIRAEKT